MKRILASGLFLTVYAFAGAQFTESFEEFRSGILSDYQDFRKTILDHYADFLEGKWHEYEPMMPMERDRVPKPVSIPDVKLAPPSLKPVTMPEPVLVVIPENTVTPDKPVEEKKPEKPGIPPSPFDVPETDIPPEAGNEIPLTLKVRPDLGVPVLGVVAPLPLPVPVPGEGEHEECPEEQKPEVSKEGKDPVDFYGMEVLVPKVDFNISESLTKVSDLARHWKLLDGQNVAEKVNEALSPVVREMSLNDYLAYELLCSYVDSKFPNAALSSKMSAVHYILANMGFNARIAVVKETGEPIMLVPSRQKLYGIGYMPINGENYYILGNRDARINGCSIVTCDLPKVASSGKKFDMVINGLSLPRKERKFEMNHGGLSLSGVVNENLMPVVYRYPQMDIKDYAVSFLDKDLRINLVEQVKKQLDGEDRLKAVNALLQLMQRGFEYSTDHDFHGFEKPYFIEENFYYPKNDCEDRALVYTYLLWNALGVESQLLAFPGHESSSVSLPGADVKGTSYMHEGKRYYISDPTYIGSSTGMCMPSYEQTAPKIDFSYPSK